MPRARKPFVPPGEEVFPIDFGNFCPHHRTEVAEVVGKGSPSGAGGGFSTGIATSRALSIAALAVRDPGDESVGSGGLR